MRLKSFFKILFIFILFFHCKKNIGRYSVINASESKSKVANSVVFKINSEDSIARKSLLIINNNNNFGIPFKRLNDSTYNNTLYFSIEPIIKSQLLEMMVWDEESKFYNTYVYINPGDTISLSLNDKIEFTGVNGEKNNMLFKLYNNPEFDYARNPYTGNIMDYKQLTYGIYKRRIDFIDKNAFENNINSIDFLTLVKDVLKFEYLYNLACPRLEPNPSIANSYFNSLDGLNNIVENEYLYKEGLFNSLEYFDNISLNDYKNSTTINNSAYKSSLIALIRYYFETSEHEPFTKEKLEKEIEFIQNELDQDLKNYAIIRTINDYTVNGFGFSKGNVEYVNELISKYEDEFGDDLYAKEKLESIKEDLNSFNHRLSEFALNSKLINLDGDTLTSKEIFNKPSKKVRVINFWASWCAPCIDEIIKAKSFRDKLSIEGNVEWIYLSIDKDKTKWLNKSKELNKYLNVWNQYLVVNGKNSSLAKYLKVSLIPRYIIINKQNKIVFSNAPRPSDTLVFNNIIKNIR